MKIIISIICMFLATRGAMILVAKYITTDFWFCCLITLPVTLAVAWLGGWFKPKI